MCSFLTASSRFSRFGYGSKCNWFESNSSWPKFHQPALFQQSRLFDPGEQFFKICRRDRGKSIGRINTLSSLFHQEKKDISDADQLWGIRNLTNCRQHSQYCSFQQTIPAKFLPSGQADYLLRFLPIDASAKVAIGSLTAAHHNYLGARCVPFSAPYTAHFSVSFGENSRSDSVNQRPRCAQRSPSTG